MENELFNKIVNEIIDYRAKGSISRVGVNKSYEELCSQANRELPDTGESTENAISSLISSVKDSLIHSVNPRYFGFVIGGSTPASLAADWLTSGWDQNGQVYNTSPAAAIIEDIVSAWILDLLDLPQKASVGYVTGGQMANFVGLSLARNHVLSSMSWDVEKKGLQNSPHINVICSECCHATIHSAVRLMGLGTDNIINVSADQEGRIKTDELYSVIANCHTPFILSLQAGNVNTGAFDNFEKIIDFAHSKKAWVHVDGAFGLWARATEKYKHLTTDIQKADSWSIDAHKWLNVPFDSGMIIVRDSNTHKKLKTNRCAYAGEDIVSQRDGSTWVPENSRRARAFVLYASLRNLGREGVKKLIQNSCELAKIFELELKKIPEVRVLNEVVLNQILFCIEPQSISDIQSFNEGVAKRIQNLGICWLGTTIWEGATILRISISNHSTTKDDILISIQSIKKAIDAEEKMVNKSI